MGSTTNMAPFVKYLIFTAVCLLIGGNCDEHSVDRRANVVKRADNNTYYNIYTKINTLEKYVSNLETKLQNRTKLLRKMLKSVLELDSNLGFPNKNLKKENIEASKKNGNFFRNSIFILILEVLNLVKIHLVFKIEETEEYLDLYFHFKYRSRDFSGYSL